MMVKIILKIGLVEIYLIVLDSIYLTTSNI